MRSRASSQARANLCTLGVWRSLVARSVRVGEVPSSNLGTPTECGGTFRFPRRRSCYGPVVVSLHSDVEDKA
jgi:hypothetical protein